MLRLFSFYGEEVFACVFNVSVMEIYSEYMICEFCSETSHLVDVVLGFRYNPKFNYVFVK